MPSNRRQYELPGIEDLTKEQEAVLALPAEGRHLVVGGPGTGKTVVCLLRTRRHARNRDDYVFLVWNHLLQRASKALMDGELEAATWQSWFSGLFKEEVGAEVPTQDPPDGNDWRPTDWDKAERLIEELPSSHGGPPARPLLVIDEGQDMPPGFYDSLLQLGFESIFVAADQNQQIKDENSSISELRDALLADAEDLTKLTYNHRNVYPIARLAREFYTGDPASPPPELPLQRGNTVYTPPLYRVNGASLPRIGRSILTHWDQDPRRLIGVIAPNNDVRKRYLDAVKRALSSVSLDNGRPTIETFYGNYRPDVRFDRGGILVINAQACKGLEFDTVVLADIDEHVIDAANPDRVKKLFYVMVSRARRRVVMFMKAAGSREIKAILPADDGVLRRNDLTGEDSDGGRHG